MVAGLIHDVPTVKALIDDIVGQAEKWIGSSLRSMMGGASVDNPNRSYGKDASE
ncbi:hypothetical protein [Burkholderia sp. IMCC1007]|uniref:hypothetical protein n=1 Tax=Burkholderia sp. IMCC1007 TaxID=3004104 RepID=UPI0022B46110|nr:hypothetical protein [Burkholderia sp. IMCC1007]